MKDGVLDIVEGNVDALDGLRGPQLPPSFYWLFVVQGFSLAELTGSGVRPEGQLGHFALELLFNTRLEFFSVRVLVFSPLMLFVGGLVESSMYLSCRLLALSLLNYLLRHGQNFDWSCLEKLILFQLLHIPLQLRLLEALSAVYIE